MTHRVESKEKRRQRLSTGGLIAVIGVLLLIALASTTGDARFALSDAFDEVQLPTLTVPGVATVAICAVLCLLPRGGFPKRADAGPDGGGRWNGRRAARSWSAS